MLEACPVPIGQVARGSANPTGLPCFQSRGAVAQARVLAAPCTLQVCLWPMPAVVEAWVRPDGSVAREKAEHYGRQLELAGTPEPVIPGCSSAASSGHEVWSNSGAAATLIPPHSLPRACSSGQLAKQDGILWLMIIHRTRESTTASSAWRVCRASVLHHNVLDDDDRSNVKRSSSTASGVLHTP